MDAIAKEQLLRSAGYYYDFERMAYVNRREKKVFSIEAMEDHSEEWIRQRIAQPNDSGEWVFFSNEPLSPAVEEILVAKLG
jgi:hypothetical protein